MGLLSGATETTFAPSSVDCEFEFLQCHTDWLGVMAYRYMVGWLHASQRKHVSIHLPQLFYYTENPSGGWDLAGDQTGKKMGWGRQRWQNTLK